MGSLKINNISVKSVVMGGQVVNVSSEIGALNVKVLDDVLEVTTLSLGSLETSDGTVAVNSELVAFSLGNTKSFSKVSVINLKIAQDSFKIGNLSGES